MKFKLNALVFDYGSCTAEIIGPAFAGSAGPAATPMLQSIHNLQHNNK